MRFQTLFAPYIKIYPMKTIINGGKIKYKILKHIIFNCIIFFDGYGNRPNSIISFFCNWTVFM